MSLQILKTEPVPASTRRKFELTDLHLLTDQEIADHALFLPAGSIFKLGNDASTAIADVIRIRNGAVVELNEESNSTDLHFARAIKATIKANKSFHVLVVPGQEIRVENTGNTAIYVWNSHFRIAKETGNVKTGSAHAKPRMTVQPGQTITV